MTDQLTVSVLGTGIMGAAMARNLVRAGHTVRAWNRTAPRPTRWPPTALTSPRPPPRRWSPPTWC